jgi:hypothetical protein
MAKAIAAQAGDRISDFFHNLDFSSPLFTGGALAIFKRFGPVGLIAAAVGGYALKRHLSKPARSERTAAPVETDTPKAKTKKKSKSKK